MILVVLTAIGVVAIAISVEIWRSEFVNPLWRGLAFCAIAGFGLPTLVVLIILFDFLRQTVLFFMENWIL